MRMTHKRSELKKKKKKKSKNSAASEGDTKSVRERLDPVIEGANYR
jgi:hypothetical protein